MATGDEACAAARGLRELERAGVLDRPRGPAEVALSIGGDEDLVRRMRGQVRVTGRGGRR